MPDMRTSMGLFRTKNNCKFADSNYINQQRYLQEEISRILYQVSKAKKESLKTALFYLFLITLAASWGLYFNLNKKL